MELGASRGSIEVGHGSDWLTTTFPRCSGIYFAAQFDGMAENLNGCRRRLSPGRAVMRTGPKA